MYLLKTEISTAVQALADSEAWARPRGFSVLADRCVETRDVLGLEAVLGQDVIPLSDHDNIVLGVALRRVGGTDNELLWRALGARPRL